MIRSFKISIALIFGGLVLSGCLHTPPAGAERGIVSIKNDRLWDDPDLLLNIGTLTGIAIEDHVILTAAHTLMYEPLPNHPLRINGERVSYEIIADGWEGMRGDLKYKDKQVPNVEYPINDYLLIHTAQRFESNPDLVPMSFERVADVRDTTLVTRRKDSGEIETLPLRSLSVSVDGKIGYTTLKKSARFDPEDYFLSGSPLIGRYQDGTLILIGIVNSRGMIQVHYDRERWANKKDQMLFTPIWTIPVDLIESK